MRLAYLRKRPLESAFICYLLVVGLAGLPVPPLGGILAGKEAAFAGLALVRLAAALVFFGMMCGMGLSESLHFGGKRALPALCVAGCIAINNLPIWALSEGSVSVMVWGGAVYLLAAECICVALFEELSFRGTIFPLLMQAYGTDARGRALAVVNSSLLFGGLHLLNVFAGGGTAQSLLQAGYSFLIGAMLCVCMLEGAGVGMCAWVHAVYNFCGLLVSELGRWDFYAVWNVPTVCITVLLGAAAIVFFTLRLVRHPGEAARLSRPSARIRLLFCIR